MFLPLQYIRWPYVSQTLCCCFICCILLTKLYRFLNLLCCKGAAKRWRESLELSLLIWTILWSHNLRWEKRLVDENVTIAICCGEISTTVNGELTICRFFLQRKIQKRLIRWLVIALNPEHLRGISFGEKLEKFWGSLLTVTLTTICGRVRTIKWRSRMAARHSGFSSVVCDVIEAKLPAMEHENEKCLKWCFFF